MLLYFGAHIVNNKLLAADNKQWAP